MKHTQQRTWVVGVATLLAMGAAAHRADASSINIKLNLSQTGVDPNASGQAVAQISRPKSGMRARLNLKARRLDPNSTYVVLVNGVRVGTLTTTPGGNAQARFSSQPHGKDQLLGVDPRGTQIGVSNTNGDSVLETQVPDNTIDPTAVRCCLPHSGDSNEQPECEDLTADACTAAGGTNLGAGSCLPNPCAAANPPAPQDQVVCCTPEDNQPQCEMRSSAGCSNDGGINLGAGSCDPNPCAAPTPSTPETVQCCLPEDSGSSECEHRTPDLCTAQGGTSMGPGTCSPNPCSSQPAADQVRCCLPTDSGGVECEQRTADQCSAQGGTSIGAGSCDANACSGTTPPPTGDQIRCCLQQSGGANQHPECESRTADQCTAQGGTNMGPGPCDPNPCV